MLQVKQGGTFVRTRLMLLCVVLPCLVGVAVDRGACAERAPIGRQIESFSLRDFYGKEHTLDACDANLVVVVFLGTECPLAKLYAPRIEALNKRFGDRSVAFLGINSNMQDGITEISAYAQRHGLSFPVLKDPGNQIANLFEAERTPEVFVLDRERIVRYCGRVDDQYGVGYQRPNPKRADLAIAIEELLAGKAGLRFRH